MAVDIIATATTSTATAQKSTSTASIAIVTTATPIPIIAAITLITVVTNDIVRRSSPRSFAATRESHVAGGRVQLFAGSGSGGGGRRRARCAERGALDRRGAGIFPCLPRSAGVVAADGRVA